MDAWTITLAYHASGQHPTSEQLAQILWDAGWSTRQGTTPTKSYIHQTISPLLAITDNLTPTRHRHQRYKNPVPPTKQRFAYEVLTHPQTANTN
jgi:hypothetical protein